jgi:hypothetical protein
LSPLGIMISLTLTLFLIFVVLNNVYHALRQQQDAPPLLWLLVWSLTPLLGTFLISLVRPIFQLRTVLTAAPAFYLLVAWGVVRASHKHLNLPIFLAVVVLMVVSAFNFYMDPIFAKPTWRQAAQYVQARVQPGDVVIHTSPGSYFTFLVYPHSVVHVLLPGDPTLTRQNAPSQAIETAVGGAPQPIDQAVQGYHRVWLVVALDQAIQHQQQQKQVFDARYKVVAENQIGGIYIFTYTLD